MQFEPKQIELKNGKSATLRAPRTEDAAAFLLPILLDRTENL